MRPYRPRPLPLGSLLWLVAALGGAAAQGSSSTATAPARPVSAPAALTGRQPVQFVQNVGQARPEAVRFYTAGRDRRLAFDARGYTLGLSRGRASEWAVRVDFVGAREGASPSGDERAPTRISFLRGPRASWKTEVPAFASVVYHELWPGIDLRYTAETDRVKYTLALAPGADPRRIAFRYAGVDALRVAEDQSLVVSTPAGSFRDGRPAAWQEVDEQRRPVPVKYRLQPGHVYGFELGSYDPTRPVLLDPALLVYSGFLGGSDDDEARAVAVDDLGNAYLTGTAASTNFPTTAGSFTYAGQLDAFVLKVPRKGTTLEYATYLGSSGDDYGNAIAVDSLGQAYVAGEAGAADFPASFGTFGGTFDGFVAKLSPQGNSLLFSRVIGGTDESDVEEATALALDPTSGAVLVAGTSDASDFPASAGFSSGGSGLSADAWLCRVAGDGSSSTCGEIGGDATDEAAGVAVDGTGAVYLVGSTDSTESDNFPVGGGFDGTHGGQFDAFVAKVAAGLGSREWVSYLGGAGQDEAAGVALSSTGDPVVAGYSDSGDFPVVGGPSGPPSSGDAFVTRIAADGATLAFSGTFGGSGTDQASAVAVDASDRVWVGGLTDSTDFPVQGGPQTSFQGGTHDGFVTRVAADGSSLESSGYLGGSDDDGVLALAVDSLSALYVAGATQSGDFPALSGGLARGGQKDGFVAKLAPHQVLVVDDPGDAVDDDPGDGLCGTAGESCTLRAAVMEANALAGAQTIRLPSGTYTLSNTGSGEDLAATGDLDVRDELIIEGSGKGATFIDGGTADRVLEVREGARLVLDDVTVTGGQEALGGGILVESGSTLEGRGLAVAENYATGAGGGIHNSGTLVLTESALRQNKAAGNGGGLRNEGAGSATLDRSVLAYNRSGGSGGGISSVRPLTLDDTTLSGNTAAVWGGGLSQGGSTTSTLHNVTVVQNTAVAGGGAYAGVSAGFVFRNSILAGNTDSDDGASPDCFFSGVTATSEGHNLVGDATGCTFTAGTGDQVGAGDPLLGPLVDNGGPTFTHANLVGSPALDAGDTGTPGSGGTTCAALDQRRVPRPSGSHCDVGAYEGEINAAAELEVSVSDDPDPVDLNSSIAYDVALFNNGPDSSRTILLQLSLAGPGTIDAIGAGKGVGLDCENHGTSARCYLDPLGSGLGQTVSVTVNPSADGFITLSASVAANAVDGTTSNNTDSETTLAGECTIHWTGAGDGLSWSAGANWDLGFPPGVSDAACIPTGATVEINDGRSVEDLTSRGLVRIVSGGSLSVLGSGGSAAPDRARDAQRAAFGGGLDLDGGMLTVDTNLSVAGTFHWTAGTLAGTAFLTVPSGSTMLLDGVGTKLLTGHLANAGTATWAGTGEIAGANGAELQNQGTGVFEIVGDSVFRWTTGATPSFSNAGTLRKTGGAGTTEFQATLNNGGTLEVQSGTVLLGSGSSGTTSGTVDVSAGARLEYANGTHTWNGANFTGAGSVRVSSNATVGVSGTVTGSSLLEQTGGTVNGAGILSLTGVFDWSGGTQGGTGSTVVSGAGKLEISGASAKSLNTRLVEHAGTTAGRWLGSGTISGSNGSVLRVATGSLFVAENDATITLGAGAATVLDVQGTFRKNGGSGDTTVACALNNTGTVQVQTGNLLLPANSSGTSTGSFTIAAGSKIEYTSGSHTWNGASFSGAGDLTLGGATVAVTGTVVSNAKLVQTSGTLNGTGSFNAGAGFDWSGGTQGGSGTTSVIGGVLAISGNGAKTLNTRTVETSVNGTWTGTGALDGSSGGRLRVQSGATLDLQSSPSFTWSAGATSQLVVEGTFRKSTSTGTFTVNGKLDTTGTVDVQAGTLLLGNSSTSSSSAGSYSISNGASLQFGAGSGTHTWTGASFSGAGSLLVAAGTVTTSGTSTSTALLTQSGGVVNGNGTLNLDGGFTWTGGTQSGAGGTTQVRGGTLAISGAGGKTLSDRQFITQVGGAWSGADISASNASLFRVESGAVLQLTSDASFTWVGGAAPTFNISGGASALRKTGGTGTSTLGGTVSNSGTVSAESGTLAFGSYTQSGGSTILNGGNLSCSGAMTFSGGFLSGIGTITANVNNSGATVRPGASPGILNVTGNYTQSGTGVLEVEIDGTVAGTSYDRLAVSGSVTRGGTLKVLRPGTFTPVSTDIFTILTGSSIGGAWSTVNNAFNSFGFAVNSTATTVQVVRSPANCVWDGSTGNTWDDPAHWTSCATGTGTVPGTPGPVDSATINGGDVTLNFDTSVTNFTQGGGTLTGTGTLTVTGTGSWTAGLQSGSGKTLVASTSTWTLSSASTKSLNTRTLQNDGTLNWTGGLLTLDGSLLETTLGALFDVTFDGTLQNLGGAAGQVVNRGTLRKSGGGGPFEVGNAFGNPITLRNYNVVDTQTGTLDVNRGGSIENAASYTGAGTTRLRSAVALNGTFGSQNLVLLDGSLSGTGTVGGGTLFWSGGTLSSGALLIVDTSGTLALNTGSTKTIDGATLRNLGTVNWTGGQLTVAGALLENKPGALFNVQFDGSLVSNGGTSSNFENRGILRKSGGGGALAIGTAAGNPTTLTNYGVVDSLTGSIDVNRGGTIEDGASFTGSASTRIRSTVTMNSASFSSQNLQLFDGALAGTGTLSSGTLTWSGGSLNLGTDLTVDSGATLSLQSASAKTMSSATLHNDGTVTWTGGILSMDDSLIDNTGLFDVQFDATLQNGGGAASTFENHGTLRKSGGGGAFSIGTGTGNATSLRTFGAVEANSATIDINRGGIIEGGASFTGGGSTRVRSAVALNGSFTATNLQVLDGSLTGTGTLGAGSTFTWSGGSLAATLTVANGATLRLDTAATKTLSAVTLRNEGTVVWTGGQLTLSPGVIDNQPTGLFDAQFDATIAGAGGSPSRFENRGTLRKSAGGGAFSLGTGAGDAVKLEQFGTVNSQVGTIDINRPGTIENGASFTGSASTRIRALVTLSNASFGSQNLQLLDGSLDGTGTLATGTLTWSGGSIADGTLLVVASGATLRLDTGTTKTLGAATLRNLGTVTWTGGQLTSNAGIVENKPSGLFDVQFDGFIVGGGGATSRFENKGTLRKSGGGGPLNVGVSSGDPVKLEQYGVLETQVGTTDMNRLGTIEGGASFTGGGTARIRGTVFMNGGSFSAANLQLLDGTLDGIGTLTSGTLSWSGGTVAAGAALTVGSGAGLSLNGGTTKTLAGGLRNQGNTTWSGGVLSLGSGAFVDNQSTGIFDAGFDCTIAATAAATFDNAGTFRKSGGGGSCSLSAAAGLITFNNSGTLDIRVGAFAALAQNFTQTAGSTLLAGGSLSTSGTLNFQGGSLEGNGTVTGAVNHTGGDVRPGSSAGAMAISGTYTMGPSATLRVELGGLGPGSQYDRLTVSGAAALNGTIAVSLINGFDPAPGNTFQPLTYGSRSGSPTFTGLTLSGGRSLSPSFGANVLTLTTLASDADLAVSISDSPDPVATGADLTYTVVVTNNGPGGATNVVLDDTLPGGVNPQSASSSQGSCGGTFPHVVCSLGSIAASGSATVTIVVKPTVDSTTITNSATVDATENDPTAGNDTDSENTLVNPAGCTIFWDGPASGAWETPSNWSTDALPGPADDVCIAFGKTVTRSVGTATVRSVQCGGDLTITGSGGLDVSADSYVAGAFVLNGGILRGTGTVELRGTSTITNSTLADAGLTRVTGSGSLTFNTPASVLDTRTLRNQGTVTGALALANNAVIDNQAQWELLDGNQFTGAGSFNNSGTLHKAGTAAASFEAGVRLDNTAAGVVDTKLLDLRGGGTNAGSFAGDGITIRSSYTFSSGASVSAAGVVYVATPAVLSITGPVAVNGELGVGGAATIDVAAGVTVNVFGTLECDSVLRGGDASTSIINVGTHLQTVAPCRIDTLTLNSGGTWDARSLEFRNGSVVRNKPTGTMDISTDGTFGSLAGLGAGTFVNEGLVRKVSGTGTTVFGGGGGIFTFTSSGGTVEAQTGRILTGTGGSGLGVWKAQTGASIEFANGFSFATGSSFEGAGSVRLTGGSFPLSGSYSSQNLDLAGGSIQGTATVSGTLKWTASTLGGVGSVLTIPVGSSLAITGGSDRQLNSGYTLQIDGDATWTGTGNINSPFGATINTGADAVFDVQTDADFLAFVGSSAEPVRVGASLTLNNAGTFRKTAGTGSTSFPSSASVTNTGLFQAASGTLDLAGAPYSQSAGETRLAGGGLSCGATPIFFTGGLLTGSGPFNCGIDNTGAEVGPGASPGVLNLSSYSQSNTGKLKIELGGPTPGSGYDQLVATGAVQLGATLEVVLANGFDPPFNSTYTVVTGSPVSGTFSTVIPPALAAGKAMQVIYNANDVTLRVFATDANLKMFKQDDVDPALVGNNVVYTLKVQNAGPAAATQVHVVDTLPAGLAFVSADTACSFTSPNVTCDLASLAAGADAFFSVTVTSNTPGTYTNSVTVSATEPDPTSSDNTATATTTFNPKADLALSKTDGPDPVLAGADLTYGLSVANNGPSTATGVAVTDQLPASVVFVSASPGCTYNSTNHRVTCSQASLVPTSTAAFSIVVRPQAAGSITNQAMVSATEADHVPGNNNASASTTVQPATDLRITKTDSADPVTAGTAFSYTLTVANLGPLGTTSVQVTDTLPAGLTFLSAPGCTFTSPTVTCTAAALASGASTSFTINVSAANTGSLSNTATVSSSLPDPASANNQATEATLITAGAPGTADLQVGLTASPEPVNALAALTYTLSVTNAGPAAAQGIQLFDYLPAGVEVLSLGTGCNVADRVVTCGIGTMAAGASTQRVITVRATTAPAVLTNSATLEAIEPDPNVANNSASVQSTVRAVVDVAATLADAPDPVGLQGRLTYTVGLRNAGPFTASNVSALLSLAGTVTVLAPLPSGCTAGVAAAGPTVTCVAPLLAKDASTSFAVAVRPTALGPIGASVTATEPEVELNSADNTASATTQVNASADLSMDVSDDVDPVAVGANITYTLLARNNGPLDANGVVIYDYLPGGVTLLSTSAGCTVSDRVVACPLAGKLTSGATASATIIVRADQGPSVITNGAVVDATEIDIDPSNDSDQEPTTVSARADLVLTNVPSSSPAVVGANLTYTLTVANRGPSTATNLRVVDTLPSGPLVISIPAGCTNSSGVVTCTQPLLASGASAVFRLVVRPLDTTTLVNSALASSAEVDPTPSDNTATVSTPVNPPPNLTVADATVVEGQSATTQLAFVLSFSAPSSAPVSVSYTTTAGTAEAGIDYTAAAGVLTLPAGTSTATISVPVFGDTVDENDETVFLDLSDAFGAVLTRSRATGTIRDDDPVAPGHLVSPAPQSTLAGAAVVLGWEAGRDVSEYWVQVGTQPGAWNLYNATAGTALTHTVAGLPVDGRALYVRLWSKIGAEWLYEDVAYAALDAAAQRASVADPPAGSVLAATTATFSWNASAFASEYWLQLGTRAGGYDLLNTSTGSATAYEVTGLPHDGRTLYARLWSRIEGLWFYADATYQAATIQPTRAHLTTPAAGSTLGGSSAAFSWTAGQAVSSYWLEIGSSAGAHDLYGASEGTALTRTVSGLPTDGRTLFVRLWSLISGTWLYEDTTLAAAEISAARATLISPAPGSTLPGGSADFTWTTGTSVAEYWLQIGRAAGGYDLHNASAGTALGRTVSALPVDGRTLYVRLWSRLPGGAWVYSDSTCLAADRVARLSLPTPGSTLPGSTVTFGWTPGSGVSEYWLQLGSTAAGYDLYDESAGGSTLRTVSGLPLDGRTITARIWSKIDGAWYATEATYRAGR